MSDSSELIFVSHAGPDGQWAEWVAWHLQEAGYQVELDMWHWRTGDDFVKKISEALERASAVVAVFSPHYFAPGRFTEEEWSAVVARRGRFIPLVVEPLEAGQLPAILAPRLYKELHGLEEEAAVSSLLTAVRGPALPARAPAFPGAAAPKNAPAASAGSVAPHGPQPRFPSSDNRPAVWDVRQRWRNPHFTGREAVIEDVRRKLLAEPHAAVQALHGTGGIGKTQVALEYAYRYAAQYDLVWWVDAEQGEQVAARYAELAARVGVAKPDAGVEINARYAMEYLRGHDRWLIVLDNAEDPERVRAWLPEGPGHVLITARNPAWSKIVPGLPLGVFSRAESLAYLEGQLPTLTPAQAEALAEALGDLPLALAQAAGVMSDGVPPDRYLQVLKTNTTQLLGHSNLLDYPVPLAGTVTIATERLDADHPEATAVLRLAAFLGPEPIPTSWLVAARPVLTTVPGDPDDFRWPQNALNPLARYGLAVVGPHVFQVHRLTQAVMRHVADGDAAAALHDDVAALLTGEDPGHPDVPASWPRWGALTPHLVATLSFMRDRDEMRSMLLKAARYLVRSAQPQAAHGLAATMHETWIASLGEDHADTLRAAHMVTWALDGLSAYAEALPLVEDILERRRRVLGEDDPDTLSSAHDLAVTLSKLGREADAFPLHEDVLERRRRVLGDDDAETLRSAHDFAIALSESRRYSDSHRQITDVLKRRMRVLGKNHPDTLRSLHTLGFTLNQLGQYDEAHRLLTDVLERRRQLLGDDYPDTLDTADSVAIALNNLGRHAEAERLLRATRARVREVLGADHRLFPMVSKTLAATLMARGKLHEAQKLMSAAQRNGASTTGTSTKRRR